MPKIKDIFKTEIIRKVVFPVIGTVLAACYYLFYLLFSEVSTMPKEVLAHLMTIGFYILIGLILYIIYLYISSKNPMRNFDYDQRFGILRNKKDGIYYCTSCFQQKLRSPLIERKEEWICSTKECEKSYKSPDYKTEPFHYPTKNKTSFTDGFI